MTLSLSPLGTTTHGKAATIKIKRPLIAGFSALLIATSAGVAYAASAEADTSIMRATTAVNVRTGPDTTYPLIGVLYQGETVTATGLSQEGWIPVTFNGKSGWICAQYLAGTAPATPEITGRASATTGVNIRAKATTLSSVLYVLQKGQTIDLLGPSANGWTPVLFQGKTAYVSSQYLTAATPSTTTQFATTAVNVRTGPATSYTKVGLAAAGAAVQVTGKTSGEWSEVIWQGAPRWICNLYLSTNPPSGINVPGPIQGAWQLPGVQPQTQNIVNVIRSLFGQINTVYGYRYDPGSDHHTGHAADFMIPSYKTNVDLGWQIANYAKDHAKELKVQYVIFQQQIWNIDLASKGWRAMADRGSDTQNHKDHVHISLK